VAVRLKGSPGFHEYSFGSLMNLKINSQQPVLLALVLGGVAYWSDEKLIISSTPNQDNPLMDVAKSEVFQSWVWMFGNMLII